MAENNKSQLSGKETKTGITDGLLLTEPSRSSLTSLMEMLERAFNKNQLWVMCHAFQSMLRNRKAVLIQMRNGAKRPCTEMSAAFIQNSTKGELSRVLAIMLCEPDNLRFYIESLTEEQRELWRRVLVNVYVSVEEARKILKTDDLIGEERISYYHVPKINIAELDLLTLVQGLVAKATRYNYRQRTTFITVSRRLHPYFFRAFFPEAYADQIGHAQLPGDNLVVCGFESESVVKFGLIGSLIQAGELGMRVKGVSQSDIKRVAKKVGLEEFPLEDGPQTMLRSRYYLETLALGAHVAGIRKLEARRCEMVLRDLFTYSLKNLYPYLIPMLLPHIKGLRQRFIEYNTISIMVSLLLNSLREEPESWLSFRDVLMCSFVSPEYESRMFDFSALVFGPSNQSDNVELVNDFSCKVFAEDSFVMEFGYTSLQAMGFLLCSMGMAELALSPLHRPESPFARAEYIRLTALGRYALGVTSDYEPPRIEQNAYFELDPDRLIIRSLVEPNPYAQLLRDTSVPISKNRFETSASSFLANCKSRDDVENKIAVFQQFISSELPSLWKQFFHSLLRHCNPLVPDGTPYKHFRLAPDDTELIRLLTTDERLRRLVIRAEGYLILVRQEDIRKFEDALKKHGYML